ncbi:hypothetical protein CHH28_00090 [Bacterioplanes sanyensis]|uniref:Uncharacterized protein n=1 Tax=Bacterioplanes sanyensis TaxID=1249553 RepID=A0A222FDU1_9GAMM|nr:hypothetical protein [Bacterioplanes sanyensis]ASP37178.1 hypothetical protein CHH28_00090 [Bacterioplanes sanyensis]
MQGSRLDGGQHGADGKRYAVYQQRAYSQFQLVLGITVLALVLAFLLPRSVAFLEEAQRLQVMATASRFRAAILTLRASWWSNAQRPVWLELPLVSGDSAELMWSDRLRPNTSVDVAKGQQTAADDWPKTSKLDAVRMSASGWPLDWQALADLQQRQRPAGTGRAELQPDATHTAGCQRLWLGVAVDQLNSDSWLANVGLLSALRLQQVVADGNGCLYLLAVDAMPELAVQSVTAEAKEAWLSQAGKQGLIHYSVQQGRITWQFR